MNLGTKPLASASRALTCQIKNGAVASQTGELLLLVLYHRTRASTVASGPKTEATVEARVLW